MKNKLLALFAATVLLLPPSLVLAQDEPPQMNNLAVTDLSLSSALIGWTTDQKTIGNRVEIVTPDTTLVYDDSYTAATYVHLVQVTDLSQETEYSYRIISGDQTWDNGGQLYKFTTLGRSTPFLPKSISGQLVNSWGSAVERAMIRIWVKHPGDYPSLPRTVLTAITGNSDGNLPGTWVATSNTFYDQNGNDYYTQTGDQLILQYVPNYWTEYFDSSYTVPDNSPYYFGEKSILVTDPNATGEPGDVDGNGTLNIFDMLDLLKVIGKKVTPDPRMQAACDLDGNGKINIFDLLSFLEKLKAQRKVTS